MGAVIDDRAEADEASAQTHGGIIDLCNLVGMPELFVALGT